ncbi:MAG: bis(5'-nucleosyl)-tetraphosphatase (symmetrical) YqeK [Lachnospiraceae bacterium]|nr:bis(5'-nucleosyl)-tetraphosphatase (symmetrical) YqeK [Lachnospiraceae bacterium]
MKYSKIRKKLKDELDPKRYEHTLGVASTAVCLAMVYDEDLDKATTAGLLHDCAKCLTNEERIKICKKNQIEITEAEYENPFLLHAKVGSYLAEKEYEVTDEDVLMAIRSHTTGRPGMSTLEKIIYVADYIEPNRNHSGRLPELRKLAFQDLDKALIQILKDTLGYLDTTDAKIDPMTKETYEYYCNK